MIFDSSDTSLIVRSVRADRATLLAMHARDPERFPAFFESAASSATLGRFDILFAYPQQILRLQRNGAITGPVASKSTFLAALDEAWLTERRGGTAMSLPFTGGWLLYLAYELAGEIEPSLTLPFDDELVAAAVRIPAAIVRDVASGHAWIVVEHDHERLISALEQDISSASDAHTMPTVEISDVSEEQPEPFLTSVTRAQDYIRAGDIYQANLSRRWDARITPTPSGAALYQRLRSANPAPFAAVARFDDLQIASSSPERLLAVRDNSISTRPIAGTRPRHADAISDEAMVRELRDHPKERAEHIMLIDLERNDIGRLCLPGSVEVDEYMSIESYAHVHHIVSNVSGHLRASATPGEIIAALFPGGTITGCPKIRCMQIIAELEDCARGPYTGSLGYLNRDGTMDLNILIRTLEIRGSQLSFRAGAGIVADSVPLKELDETRAKARGLLRALGV